MHYNSLATEFQKFIHLSKYARWDYDKKRRETWNETVERYIQFFIEHLKERCNYDLTNSEIERIRDNILNLQVMPSMRALMTAGPALKRDELSGYNCSYIAINRVRAFDEIFFLLMCGSGVGFSVERQNFQKLPTIEEEFYNTDTTIVVADSKLGWAKALKELLNLLYIGQIPKWDMSKVRPAGSPLKIFGGKSSGPKVLDDLFEFLVNTFKSAAGRKLTSLECHDICCKIASCVVAGGVRRSATISISNLSDDRMRNAKSGQWWESFPHRALANNSVAYSEKPEIGIFMKEWMNLYDSKSGERGIFNRQGAKKHIDKFERRDSNFEMGLNPCVIGSTKIRTKSGDIEIQEIVKGLANGDSYIALTYDVKNEKIEENPIVDGCLTKISDKILEIEILDDNEKIYTIEVTEDHKIFTINRGYVEAKNLLESDIVVISTYQIITGKIKKIRKLDKVEEVYDIQVDKNHNFFANGVLVHNCGEIFLRDRQLCNLTEVVARPHDTIESLKNKVEIATILGTMQSTLTKFRYVSPDWSKNCEDERLLGVSITGIMDNLLLNGKSENSLPNLLQELKQHAIETNKIWAEKLKIEPSKAITAVKPSGTVSSLVNSSSGIHPRWSSYYLRTVRANKTESIAKFMIKHGFPHELDITNPEQTYVFYFPIKFEGNHNTSIFRGEQSAIEQLEFWKIYKDNWTEHNPSVTIYVKEHEWIEVAAWVYKHFDDICGVSFLPYTEHVYKQAPFSECTQEEYEKWMTKMPKDVDWTQLAEFEEEDLTSSAQEFACSGGSCEFVDVTN